MVRQKIGSSRKRSPSPADSSDEETYEVERIVDYRVKRGKEEYFIKWENYPDSDNTWEPIENIHCTDLINEFWASKKTDGKSARKRKATVEEPKAKRRAASSPVRSVSAQPVKESDEEAEAAEEAVFYDPENALAPEIADAPSWEHLVDEVETVEQGDEARELVVFIRWTDGKRSVHAAAITNQKCPQAMIRFYESHIKFKRPDEASEQNDDPTSTAVDASEADVNNNTTVDEKEVIEEREVAVLTEEDTTIIYNADGMEMDEVVDEDSAFHHLNGVNSAPEVIATL